MSDESAAPVDGFSIDSFLENNSGLLKISNDSANGADKLADVWNVTDTQSAFLGPSIWSSPLEDNVKLELFGLDELLDDSVALDTALPVAEQPAAAAAGDSEAAAAAAVPSSSACSADPLLSHHAHLSRAQLEHTPRRQFIDSDDECESEEDESGGAAAAAADVQLPCADGGRPAPGQTAFDPARCQLSSDQLRPLPMGRKAKKQIVQCDKKDDRYWSRRQKNNMAAKRSRDARRVKENQIILRASFLENENATLKAKLTALGRENRTLRTRLSACTCHSRL